MSAFASGNFPAKLYSLTRPTYPRRLFDYVFDYHKRKHAAKWDRALDIGCGTGQATTGLTQFREIIGLDPSEKMIRAAIANRDFFPNPTPSQSLSVGGTGGHGGSGQKFSFRRGNAEDLERSGVLNESVDLVVAAQACHWFDWTKIWPEMERVLKPGGTAAFWVYSEFRLPQYPSVTPLITAYAQGTDSCTSLGPYWERPGRTMLERHLLDVPSPEKILGKEGRLAQEERCYFAGNYHTDTLPASQTFPVIMQKEMRWRDLLGYFRTWSALEKFRVEYPQDILTPPDDRFKKDLNEPIKDDIDIWGGDLPVRFWKDLREAAAKEKERAKVEVDDKVIVEWPLAVILVSKS